ncbi:glycosyltransferase [Winogradskyella wichelsiae]|uniref:glycosyltransferase n=1 Tax=Winogradskyella wichelsiae TaxID=2697007 RepID=UPI003EF67F7E
MNIAIFSPSQNPYSETFIQAHKNDLKGNVFYYYGSKSFIQLEGSERLVSEWETFRFRIKRKLKKYSFSYVNEESVMVSLKKNKIDVVLVEYGPHAHNLLRILKTVDIPFVVHFHGYDASMRDTIKKHCNYKAVFASAKKVVAVSKVMEAKLLTLGCPKEKLIYNVYGPQKVFESVVPKFLKKQFVGIGRFTDKKAPYYTIMAFKEVIKKHPDAKLLLAGDGVLMNVCVNLVQHYGLERHVEFLGVITPEAYRDLLKESLAFVQHSITATSGDMEGTPLAVLEASVAGLPVIATYHAGIPDVIEHGKTGLLSDEHDVEGMAVNMFRVLEDVSLAKSLGQAGKKHILEHYNLEKHINNLQSILECANK